MTTILNDSINVNNIKAIVFDCDGTLFNNIPIIKAATRNILERFESDYKENGITIEVMDLLEKISESDLPNVLLDHYKLLNNVNFFKELPYAQKLEVLLMLHSKYKEYREFATLFSGTEELLKQLSEKYDLAVLTNFNKAETYPILKKFGILDYFKLILTLEDVKDPKPNPQGIQKAIHGLNYSPENVLYIGDSVTDIITAKAAHVPSIAIHNGLIPKKNLIEQHPNLICDHVTELTQLFHLPQISVDITVDQDLTIDQHAAKIKSFVQEDFNFFTLLQEVIPPELKFEANHVSKIIQDPLGFIGAVLQDGINKYTRGEIELKRQFTVFANAETELLKCLGLILIHFVNERSRDLIRKLIQNPITKIPSFITGVGLKTVYQYLYPKDYKQRFQNLFLKLFGEIIPADSLELLQEMDNHIFTSAVLDGCELALYDLGLPKIANLEVKAVRQGSLSLSNMLSTVPSKIGQALWDRITHIAEDIFEKDLRKYPEQ